MPARQRTVIFRFSSNGCERAWLASAVGRTCAEDLIRKELCLQKPIVILARFLRFAGVRGGLRLAIPFMRERCLLFAGAGVRLCCSVAVIVRSIAVGKKILRLMGVAAHLPIPVWRQCAEIEWSA